MRLVRSESADIFACAFSVDASFCVWHFNEQISFEWLIDALVCCCLQCH